MEGLTNIKRANGKQLSWLLANRCQHRHTYLTHFSCFVKDFGIEEKVGYLDIESFGLVADFGVLLSYAILDESTKKVMGRPITKAEILGKDTDKKILQECIVNMRKFDRIICHYGIGMRKFDTLFLRTRALVHHIDFPEYGELYGTDTHTIAKAKLKLHSNRQGVIAEALTGETDKTRITPQVWLRAIQGDKKALAYVFTHNIIDVKELRNNFLALKPFVRLSKTSI